MGRDTRLLLYSGTVRVSVTWGGAEDEAGSPQGPRLSPVLSRTKSTSWLFPLAKEQSSFPKDEPASRVARLPSLEKNRSLLESIPMGKGHSWEFPDFVPALPPGWAAQ